MVEDRVAPAVLCALGIEEVVVAQVDEELGARRMRIRGARHRERAGIVLQAVLGLVLHRAARGLLLVAALEAAALDHEAVDDAVEDGAVVMAFLHVL